MLAIAKLLLLLSIAGVPAAQQSPAPPEKEPAAHSTSTPQSEPSASNIQLKVAPADPVALSKQAWELLTHAFHSNKTSERTSAVYALGLVAKNSRARKLAESALQDRAPETRAAAATALGEMNARASREKLQAAMDDKDLSVALAAAHALVSLKDDSGYDVYYEALTGERKTRKGPLSQASEFKDPKKIAELGIHEGLGFVPYADIGWQAYKAIKKDDSSVVRAAAAKALANDPDPTALKALTAAAGDKNWIVRSAALEALAKRGNPAAIDTVQLYLSDQDGNVKYIAAAAALRLLAIKESGAKTAAKVPAK